MKLEFAGISVFQLDDAENGEVLSETMDSPFRCLLIDCVWLDVGGRDHQTDVPRLIVETRDQLRQLDNHSMIDDSFC